MLDMSSLNDDEVIELIDHSRGYDRELLFGVLAYSHGDSGVPFLRSHLNTSGPGSAHLRVVVMFALRMRLGPDVIPDLVEALRGGKLNTQVAAVGNLQEVDDGHAAGELFGWLRRRLRTAKRANSWGYYELSGMVRYAIRVGALPELLRLLDEEGDRLQPEEKRQLKQAWPETKRTRFRATSEPNDGPYASVVEEWYYLSVSRPVDLPDDGTRPADEWQERAIRNARRRVAKQRS